MRAGLGAHVPGMSEIDAAVAEIADEFSFFSDWEERIQHILDLGRTLAPLSEAERTEDARVRGCASQVWLVRDVRPDGRLYYRAESDAHIVRGLLAILLRIFSGRRREDIAAADPQAIFDKLRLKEALTPQRSNGVFAVMNRIKRDAA